MNRIDVEMSLCSVPDGTPFDCSNHNAGEESSSEGFIYDSPVAIRKEDGTYLILTRTWVYYECQRRQLETISLQVQELDAQSVLLVMVSESIQEHTPDPFKIGKLITELINVYSMTPTEIARRIGKSKSSISNYINIGKYDELERVYKNSQSKEQEAHSVTIGNIRETARLEKAEDVKGVAKSLRHAGITPTATSRVVKVLNSGKINDQSGLLTSLNKHRGRPFKKMNELNLNKVDEFCNYFNNGKSAELSISLANNHVDRLPTQDRIESSENEGFIYQRRNDVVCVAHFNDAMNLSSFHNGNMAEAVDLSEGHFRDLHLIVTSPPYNVGKEFEGGEPMPLMDYMYAMKLALEPALEALSPGGWCWINIVDNHVMDAEGAITLMVPHYQHLLSEYDLILNQIKMWVKPVPWAVVPFVNIKAPHTKYMNGNNHEYLLGFRKRGERSVSKELEAQAKSPLRENWTEFLDGVWHHNAVKNSQHPTPYPIEIPEKLIMLFSFPGDTVCDPFAGSGTTGKAALAHGRNCILFEREQKYQDGIREALGITREVKNVAKAG